MNITKKILVFFLLLSFVSLSAQSNKKKQQEPLVYKPGKTFVFQADYDSAGTKKTNYVVMRILDKEQEGGTAITYDYYDSRPHQHNMDSLSSISKTGYLETTQVLDQGNYIWLHPPRCEYFPPRDKDLTLRSYYDGLTQYFPFPEISLPIKKIEKKHPHGYFSINDPICNCNIFVKYQISISGYTQYQYQNKLITVSRIDGNAKSKKIGNYSFKYLFNEEFGFVHWKYNCNDIVFLELNLIDVY